MRVTVSHSKGKQEAVKIVDDTVDRMFQADLAPVKISCLRKAWNTSTMHLDVNVGLGSVGVPVRGTIDVTDTDITFDFKLPALLARLIPEKALHAAVEAKVRGLLPQR
jgi:hypothetical protein